MTADRKVVGLARLRDSLEDLALPGEAQIAALRGYVVADELALEFYHWHSTLTEEWRARLTPEAHRILDRLDAIFDEMSNWPKDDFWSEQALLESPEWERIRAMARAALEAIDAGLQ